MVDLRHHTLDLGEIDLHWAEVGEGPPVVLVHGLMDSHRTWREVWPRLRSHRLLLIDLPGHGLSGRPDAPYTPDWNATQLLRWFDHLGLDRFDLVGHSYGGGLAQLLLLKCPERLRRLGLVCPGGLGAHVDVGLRLAALAPLLLQLVGGTILGPIVAANLLRETSSDAAAELKVIADGLAQPGGARAFARTVAAVVGLRGQRTTYRDRAHDVVDLPPMRLFWGRKDRVVPYAHGAEFVRVVTGCELVSFETGHFPHWDAPDPFARELQRFLDAPDLPPVRRLAAR